MSEIPPAWLLWLVCFVVPVGMISLSLRVLALERKARHD